MPPNGWVLRVPPARLAAPRDHLDPAMPPHQPGGEPEAKERTPMSSASGPDRRSFLARSAAVAAVPAVAALAGTALAEPATAGTLPDFAPVPKSALGPAVNAQGYFVGRVDKNLYWVTDSTYQAAFLTTRDGVVLFGAPPTIGHNLQRA